jgi:coenzyme F420-0:L-glutamate ligase/coenzyme F420-1:gamma-L-glutamate ligase
MVEPGDDLASLILAGLADCGEGLRSGDVVVVAQKIVSKSEGRRVALASVTPSAGALELAEVTGKDPRLVELILGESSRVVRARRDLLIVEHRLGFVVANAGIDQSNVAAGPSEAAALLLPRDPDASAETLRKTLRERTGAEVGVVIADSFGRPWRLGTVGVALGAAGLPSLVDRRGETDLFGRTLQATVIAVADHIAAAATLLMGEAREGRPVAVVRGLHFDAPHLPGSRLLRPPQEDEFR